MILVVALGNPGEKYKDTRHNAGFMTADLLAKELEGTWGEEAASLVFHTQVGGEKVLIAMPQTYMNLSGNAVKSMINKHDLNPQDILLIYDDVDLPFGQMRVRKGGGTGGHNGVESVVEKIGTHDFTRLRIGIGRPPHPPLSSRARSGISPTNVIPGNSSSTAISDYVLEKFTPEEKEKLPDIIKEAVKKTRLLLKFGYEEFISKYNL